MDELEEQHGNLKKQHLNTEKAAKSDYSLLNKPNKTIANVKSKINIKVFTSNIDLMASKENKTNSQNYFIYSNLFPSQSLIKLTNTVNNKTVIVKNLASNTKVKKNETEISKMAFNELSHSLNVKFLNVDANMIEN